MIAMAVLAISLVAMTQMHVLGITSTAAGRRQTSAVALAGELVAGLERLGFDDALLSGPAPSTSAPTPFGRLVSGDGVIATGAHEWSDSTPVPGVRLDSQIREMSDRTARVQRRWTVWPVLAGTLVGTKIIAVSVTYNDPPFSRPREVVQYTFIPNPSIIGTALGGTP
jgi:hypothetical protein